LAETLGYGHRGNRLLAALPSETLATLDRDLKHVSIAQGAVIFEPGAPLDTIYFPQSGLISLMVVTRGGDTVEAATIGREGAVGLHGALGARLSFTRATTQVGGNFSVIRADRFEQGAGDSGRVQNLISKYTELMWAEAQQIAACNAVHDAGSRLARWLLQSSDRVGSNQLPLTQEFLAQMLGVRRTTITLLAQTMQDKGLISYSRGRIAIVDRQGLKACACECYHIISHDTLPHTIGVELRRHGNRR
jgi:CRP-like cAMP-binding protein